MASIVNEIETLAEFIEPLFAGASVHYQQVPIEPKANTLVVRYLMSGNETETGYHYRIDRDFQIVYYAQNDFACMQKFEQLERILNDNLAIPLKGSDRYLRLDSFNFSQPFKTESGVTAIIGVLKAHVREPRTQPVTQKIQHVTATINEGGR
ncbi:hypothetical protein V7149_00175 [Bacillus sp. JJ1503]|uniref:hypothetical protein n=1 Tax=Bacillus sp. JJ1503 TaxID=3122956 RepID=UPI002FFEE3DF